MEEVKGLIKDLEIKQWLSLNQYVAVSWSEWLAASIYLKKAWIQACDEYHSSNNSSSPTLVPLPQSKLMTGQNLLGQNNLQKYFS